MKSSDQASRDEDLIASAYQQMANLSAIGVVQKVNPNVIHVPLD
jgi:hypothetical protein